MPVKSLFFQLGAICVWPISSENPPFPGILYLRKSLLLKGSSQDFQKLPLKYLFTNFKNFASRLQRRKTSTYFHRRIYK